MPSYTFKDPEGTTWASEHEYRVYAALVALGAPVRRSQPGTGDTFHYGEIQSRVRCMECGSTRAIQDRTYTPDLFVAGGRSVEEESGESGGSAGYWIEAKGYFRQDKRKLFRAFRQGRPDVAVRLVVQRDHKVGKGTILTWAERYAKVEAWQWDYKRDDIIDVVPADWRIWE